MISGHEELDTVQPATIAESTALLREVINIALYGGEDPWYIDSLFDGSDMRVPDIERGYHAQASPSRGGANIKCKYDPQARDAIVCGEGFKVHIASLAMADKTYDFFASASSDHRDNGDILARLFDSLENNDGGRIVIARSLDLVTLPDDFDISVFENLPTNGPFIRSMGSLGLHFSELLEGDSKTRLVADAEGLKVRADLSDSALDLEIAMAATAIDSHTARFLARALREDYTPIARY